MCNIIERYVFTTANNYLINILKNIKRQIYIYNSYTHIMYSAEGQGCAICKQYSDRAS